jgi:hypothetical protein
MKHLIIFIVLFTVMAYSYCQHLSKTGEYTGSRSFNNGSVYSSKICVYGDLHIPVAYFNQFYCPYAIQYDRSRDRICDWN